MREAVQTAGQDFFSVPYRNHDGDLWAHGFPLKIQNVNAMAAVGRRIRE